MKDKTARWALVVLFLAMSYQLYQQNKINQQTTNLLTQQVQNDTSTTRNLKALLDLLRLEVSCVSGCK